MTHPAIQILLIEDNRTDALLLEEALRLDELNSFEFKFSERLQTGLEILHKGRFDLVLLDLGLPDSQGLETFETLHKEYPNVPVIVLSGLMDERLALEAVQSGAQDYLVKGPTTWEIAPRAIRYAIERKRAEETLRQSKQLLERTFASLHDAVFIVDAATTDILDCNPAACEIFGYSREEMLGRTTAFLHVDEVALGGFRASLNSAAQERDFLLLPEFRMKRKDGTVFPTENSVAPIGNEEGQSIGWVSVVRDITKRKQADEAVQRRNAELTALNQIGQALNKLAEPSEIFELVFTMIGTVLDQRNLFIALYDEANQKITFPVYMINGERVTGGERPLGNGITDYVVRTNTPLLIKHDLEESLSQRGIDLLGLPSRSFVAVPMRAGDKVIGVIALQDYDLENVYDEHHVELLATVASQATVALENARLYGAVQQELEERKQAEEALVESFARFHTLFEASPDALMLIDPQGNWPILDCNTAACEMNGYTRQELIGRSIDILNLTPGDETGRIEYVQDIQRTGVLRMEAHRQRKDGSIFPVETSTSMIALGGRQVVLGIDRDITERKRAEEAVKNSERRLRALIENGQDNISLLSRDGSLIWESPATVRTLGYAPDEFVSQNLFMLVHPEDLERIQGEFSELVKEPESRHYGIFRLRHRDGQWVWVEAVATNLLNEPSVEAIVVNYHDITERKQAEKVLLESEERFRTLIEQSSEGIALVGEEGNILEWNQAMERITGIPRAQAARLPIWDLQLQMIPSEYLLPGSADMTKAMFSKILRTGDLPQPEKRIEVEIQATGGERKIVAQTIFTIKTAGGYRIGSIVLDITERKRAERLLTALNRSAEAMAGALTPDEVFWAASGHLKEVGLDCIVLPLDKNSDKYVARYLSNAPELLDRLENLTGIKHQDFYFPADALELFRQMRLDNRAKLVEDAEPLVRQVLPKPLKGLAARIVKALHDPKYIAAPMTVDEIFVGVFAAQSHDLSEKDMPAITAFADQMAFSLRKAELFQQAQNEIAERKQAEEALRESEEKYRLLVENATIGIVIAQDQRLQYINPKAMELVGYSREELFSIDFAERIHPDDRDETIAYYLKFLQGGETPANHIFRILDKTGGTKWIDSNAVLVSWEARPASLNFLMEITERKKAEEALRQRLTELETLYESGLSLSQLLEPKEIAQKIIDVLAEKLDWSHTTIRSYHPETDRLELLAYNLAYKTTKKEWQEMGERFRTLISRPGDGLCGWAVQRGETIRCGDLTLDPRNTEAVPGLRSGLYVPIKTGERTIGVISIESEKPDYFTPEDEHMAVTLAAQAAVALENIRLFTDLQKSNDDLFRAYDETIEGWSQALDLRDKETEGHTLRVTALTEELARAMGIPDSDMIHIRRGALLHDIGKMGVPDRILLKPDKLTDEEWVLMRQHPVHAYNLLSRIEFLRPALNIPRYHHEKWDGSGYPEGLMGERIPLEARIFAVNDVYDALTSDRPYRPAWARDKAISYIEAQSGSYFDPKVVDVFMKIIDGAVS